MRNYTQTGTTIYGIAITGLGLVHFFYPGFRPVFLPMPPQEKFTVLPLLFGLLLVNIGVGIIFIKEKKIIAEFLGIILLSFLLLGHLPNRLTNQPEILAYWTDTIKLFALIGGAFLIAGTTDNQQGIPTPKFAKIIGPIGLYMFCIMLVLFGTDHYLYFDFVRSLVPKWIPFTSFWTYGTGIALFGSGILIAINVWRTQVSLLLAIMLLLWLVLLHLPAWFAGPDKDAVNIVRSLECFAFSGIAMICSQYNVSKKT